MEKRHLRPLRKPRKKYKRIVVDLSPEDHYTIKLEALKRNIPISTLVTKSLALFLNTYSK